MKNTILKTAAALAVFFFAVITIDAAQSKCKIKAHDADWTKVNVVCNALETNIGVTDYEYDGANKTIALKYDDKVTTPYMIAYELNKQTGLIMTIDESDTAEQTVGLDIEQRLLQKKREKLNYEIVNESIFLDMQHDLRLSF